MKLVFRFIKRHWILCAATIILLILDVMGGLLIGILRKLRIWYGKIRTPPGKRRTRCCPLKMYPSGSQTRRKIR